MLGLGTLLAQTWLLQSQEPALPSGYGASLLQSMLALIAVSILAWWLLRWGAKKGFGTGQGKHVQVIERVALDPRRALFVVKAAGKTWMVGVGDAGPPALLTELDESQMDFTETPKASFADILRRQDAASEDEKEDA